MDLVTLISVGVLDTPRKTLYPSLNRIDNIRECMYSWYLPSLEYPYLWESWENYIKLPKEDTKAYTALKSEIIKITSSEVFSTLIHCTTFLHQDTYLRKNGLVDDIVQDGYRL